MSEQERTVGLAFMRIPLMHHVFDEDEYYHEGKVHRSRKVFDGLRLYRIHVIPELFGDLEPDNRRVRATMNLLICTEEVYCAKFRQFHAGRCVNIAEQNADEIATILEGEYADEMDIEVDRIDARNQERMDFETVEAEHWRAMHHEIEELHQLQYNLDD